MTFNVKFEENAQVFNATFGEIYKVGGGNTDLPIYDGNYDVTPKVDSQRLDTAQKVMRSDLTVLAIPYAEVSNNANGKTVTIG